MKLNRFKNKTNKGAVQPSHIPNVKRELRDDSYLLHNSLYIGTRSIKNRRQNWILCAKDKTTGY